MYDGHDIGLFSGIFVFKEEIEKESPSFVRPELYEKALDFILKQNNEYKETYTRKSMIYKYFGYTPEESLNGTTILNTLALLGGVDILRVHDVKEAVEAVKIVSKTIQSVK